MTKNNWIGFGFALSAGLSISLMAGCSNTPPKSMINVQAGEHFILNQAIEIPAGKIRHYIQFGQLSSGFSHYDQHCRIELYKLPETTTIIQPQRFLIERVAIDEEMIAQQPTSLQFAANQYSNVQTDAVPIQVAFGEYQRVETMDLVYLYLKSDSQPNVYRLTCAGSLSNGNLLDTPRSYRPQREEINRILGNVGSIQD
ncbi:MAG: hypothetical protein U9R28_02880 [Pseudomonadota bacterium]|nr:hypothetical protein [Pseudomonadota bacterium]